MKEIAKKFLLVGDKIYAWNAFKAAWCMYVYTYIYIYIYIYIYFDLLSKQTR